MNSNVLHVGTRNLFSIQNTKMRMISMEFKWLDLVNVGNEKLGKDDLNSP